MNQDLLEFSDRKTKQFYIVELSDLYVIQIFSKRVTAKSQPTGKEL